MSFLKIPQLAALVFIGVALSSCALLEPYEAEKKQGNSLRSEQIEQVAIGQSAAQVLVILGTPMLTGQKPGERWIYPIKQPSDDYSNLVIYFDHQGLVSDIQTIAP